MLEHDRDTLDRITPALAELTATVEKSVPDAPYVVVLNEQAWDLQAADGSRAILRATKRLRFTQHGMLAVKQFAFAEGTIESKTVTPPHKLVGEFRRSGREYSVVSLGRECSRNDEENVTVEMVLTDSFTQPNEYVAALIEESTQELVIRVVWPEERPPSAVSLELPHAPVREVPLHQLTASGSRRVYEHRSHSPPIGGQITIRWRWSDVAPQHSSVSSPGPSEASEPYERSADEFHAVRAGVTAGAGAGHS
jgi:hypothetical protein